MNAVMTERTCAIVPAYNEGSVIAQTLRNISKAFPLVVCVNDGSTDNTAAQIAKTKAVLVSHPINMGQGAALQTGIDFALQLADVDFFVTIDADGQHSVKDAQKMVDVLKKKKTDIVLGSRFKGRAVGMTSSRRMLLRAAIAFTNRFSKIKLSDTHNGLRAFNRAFASSLRIKMSGMAHASEIIDHIGMGGWRYKEVPVTIKYTDYSRAKGQSTLNSVNILIDLFMSRAHK